MARQTARTSTPSPGVVDRPDATPTPKKRSDPRLPISGRTPSPAPHKPECHALQAHGDRSRHWSLLAGAAQLLSTIEYARRTAIASTDAPSPPLPSLGLVWLSRPSRLQHRSFPETARRILVSADPARKTRCDKRDPCRRPGSLPPCRGRPS